MTATTSGRAPNDAVIVSAVRTAIGDGYRGSLTNVSIHQLANTVVAEALKRSGVSAEDIDDLVMGEVLHGGGCIARHVAVELGLPADTPGLAVQRQCATGMTAVTVAAADIRAGMTQAAIAAGVAQMTQSPTSYMGSPFPWQPQTQWLSPSHPNRDDAPNMNMMITVGENTAEAANVTREEMDDWALGSHRKAIAAIDAGRFTDEIIGVEVRGPGGTTVFDTDEHPRRDTSAEKLASLRVLSGRQPGTITAGNSSSVNDGGAALVVTSRSYADAHGLTPLATVRSWAAVGVDPKDTGLAPTIAIPKALARGGLTLDDVELVEINEAFASMTVGTIKVLGLDPERVNVNGGAVALGHPVACSGARLLVTLTHELRRRGGGVGVATLCAGGGMGMATVIEVDAP